MGRVVKYEVVHPHRCPSCDELIGQTTKSRAWIGRTFDGCRICDKEAAALLLRAYQDGLSVVFIERGTDE